MSNIEDYKDSIEGWAEKWEKAQKDGVFKDAPSFFPSKHTADDSFFGAPDTNPTERIDEVDAKYWKAVAKLSDTHSFRPELMPALLDEVVIDKNQTAAMATAVAKSANPIRHSTTGPDQELEPASLGITFTPDDLQALDALKVKLHDLESKLSSFAGLGENSKKYEAQIANVKKKINEISDALSQGFTISQQGD